MDLPNSEEKSVFFMLLDVFDPEIIIINDIIPTTIATGNKNGTNQYNIVPITIKI